MGPPELPACQGHILAARMVLGQGAQYHPGRSNLVSPHPRHRRAHKLPSSHLKSGKATSWSGICRRKSGFWHRGFPVTIFLLRNQSPSQASWQLQLKGLASRFLHMGRSTRAAPEQPPGKGTCSPHMPRGQAGSIPPGPRTYSVERDCSVSKAPGAIVLIWLSYRESRRTLRSPVKLSLWMQLMRLFLSILQREENKGTYNTGRRHGGNPP